MKNFSNIPDDINKPNNNAEQDQKILETIRTAYQNNKSQLSFNFDQESALYRLVQSGNLQAKELLKYKYYNRIANTGTELQSLINENNDGIYEKTIDVNSKIRDLTNEDEQSTGGGLSTDEEILRSQIAEITKQLEEDPELKEYCVDFIKNELCKFDNEAYAKEYINTIICRQQIATLRKIAKITFSSFEFDGDDVFFDVFSKDFFYKNGGAVDHFNSILLEEFDKEIDEIAKNSQSEFEKYKKIIQGLEYISNTFYVSFEIYLCQHRGDIIGEIFDFLRQDKFFDHNQNETDDPLYIDPECEYLFRSFYERTQELYDQFDEKEALNRSPDNLQPAEDSFILSELTEDLKQFTSGEKIYTKDYLTPEKIAVLKRSYLMIWDPDAMDSDGQQLQNKHRITMILQGDKHTPEMSKQSNLYEEYCELQDKLDNEAKNN